MARSIEVAGVEKLVFSLSAKQLARSADNFQAFLDLPQWYKNQFHAMVDDNRPGSDVGYMNRIEGEANARDNKQYFHYHPSAERYFKRLLNNKEPATEDFFNQARAVYDIASAVTFRKLSILDDQYPGVYQRFFASGREPNFFLRFLSYYPTGEGQFLAKGHNDLAAFTLALWESAPGLRMDNGKKMQPVAHQSGQALFFKGVQPVPELPDSFKPIYHDVVQEQSDSYNASVARCSIVFFIDVLDPVTIDRELITRPPEYMTLKANIHQQSVNTSRRYGDTKILKY